MQFIAASLPHLYCSARKDTHISRSLICPFQACNKQRCIEKLERQAEELRFTSSELQGCCSEYEKDLAECKQELRATITSKHRILAEADNLQMKHQTAQKRLAEALAQLNRVCSPVKKEERVLITT